MTEIDEGKLKFSFPHGCEAEKYEQWSFYRSQFQSIADGSKAVDILFLSDDAAWLIEIKDYRHHPRQKHSAIFDEVACKVRDTLAGLAAASANANCRDEQTLARRALSRRRWRVALHLELPPTKSRLRPRPFSVPDIWAKFRKKVKAVDAHPVVVNRATGMEKVPWSAQ